MNVLGKRVHVGKLRIAGDVSLRVALSFPGVVDIYIDITGILHAARDHRVRHVSYGLVIDFAGELVPTVPAHGRRADESVVRHIMQRRQRYFGRRFRSLLGGSLRDAFARLPARELRGHVDLVTLNSAVVGNLASPLSRSEGSFKMELAVLIRSRCDRNFAVSEHEFPGDILAGLLEFEEGLAKVAVAGGDAEHPVAG